MRTHSPLVKLNNTPLARIIKSIDIGKPGLISRALGQIAYMVTRSESFLLDLKLTKRNDVPISGESALPNAKSNRFCCGIELEKLVIWVSSIK